MLSRLRIRRLPRPLALLLVVGAVEAVAWSIALPPLQGPDEVNHFAYTQRLVERGELPHRADPDASESSNEVDLASRWGNLTATVANARARPAWTRLEERLYDELEPQLPDGARETGTGLNSARNNPPLFYFWSAMPYAVGYEADFFARFQLMRLANVPLFLVLIALTWLLTAELLPRPPAARVIAAAVVTIHPQLAHFAGVLAPDLMLSTVWAGALYVFVLLVRRGPGMPLVAAAGALTGVSLSIHPRGLPLVVPAAAALALALALHREPLRRSVLKVAAFAALAILPLAAYLAAISGEPVVQGSAVTSSTVTPFRLNQFASYVWQFYLPRLPFMEPSLLGEPYGSDRAFIRLFYGAFAWQEVRYSEAIYEWLRWLTLAGLAGLAVACVRRTAALRRHWPSLLVLVLTVVSLLGAVHYSEYRELLNKPQDAQVVGRYLLPLIALFGLAIAFTLTSLPRRVAPLAVNLVVVLGALLHLAGLGLVLFRFYA